MRKKNNLGFSINNNIIINKSVEKIRKQENEWDLKWK